MAFQRPEPTFGLYETLSGDSSVSVSRLAQEVQGYSGQCACRYLDSLIMLLPGDAADWAESHPDAIGCYTAAPLQDIVSFFPTPVSPKLPFQSR